MGQFVSSLFSGGGNNGTAQLEQQRQRDLQQIAQSRAEQTAQENQDVAGKQLGAGKAVRGRRLLLSDAAGGAATLGTA